MGDVRGRTSKAGEYSIDAIPLASGLIISRDLGLTYGLANEGWIICKQFSMAWIG